ISLGLGVTIGGIVLQITRALHGHPAIEWSDFWPAFVTVGLCSFASIPVTRRLSPNAGEEIVRGKRVDVDVDAKR
ncbi:MAG TPA: hypothetical protein VGL08_14970, partial [Paraburkholderia sp.]